MDNQVPLITFYSRVVDNISGEELLSFTDSTRSSTWYYGQCDGLEGGESQYIVEFDIWNNEPAFNAGQYANKCPDAINCRLSVWPDKDCQIKLNAPLFNLSNSFMQARCTSSGYKQSFTEIKHNSMLTDINGNINTSKKGTIQGVGDHALIQTKIVLPPNSSIPSERYSFILAFYYDFE